MLFSQNLLKEIQRTVLNVENFQRIVLPYVLNELENLDFTDVEIKAKQQIVRRFQLNIEKMDKFEKILFKMKKRVARQTDWSGKIITIYLEFFYYFLLIHFSWKHFYLNSNICQYNNFEDLIKVSNSYTLTIDYTANNPNK